LWLSAPPQQFEYDYQSATGPIESDLYLPAEGGQHGAVILYTGAFGFRREPAFVRFAESLARSGAVVMVQESAALRAGEIAPEEVSGLLQALTYLQPRPEVDPSRMGIFGFSAGGSLVLLAAESDAGRDQIAFVNIFGARRRFPFTLERKSDAVIVDVRRILLLVEAERGDLEVGVRPEGFDDMVRRLERLGNRIVLGLDK
jgi:cephalosporin-C deacetylase-like acetyl esterase